MNESDDCEFFFNDDDSEADVDLVCWLLETGQLNDILQDFFPDLFGLKMPKKRLRTENFNSENYWATNWGILYNNPLTSQKGTKEYNRFRNRFRVPLPFFKSFVEKCREVNIFDNKYDCQKIPYEFKIMSCLRILGRVMSLLP